MQALIMVIRLLFKGKKFLIISEDGDAGNAVLNVDYTKSTGEKSTAYYINNNF